jgi:hypothetical protein
MGLRHVDAAQRGEEDSLIPWTKQEARDAKDYNRGLAYVLFGGAIEDAVGYMAVKALGLGKTSNDFGYQRGSDPAYEARQEREAADYQKMLRQWEADKPMRDVADFADKTNFALEDQRNKLMFLAQGYGEAATAMKTFNDASPAEAAIARAQSYETEINKLSQVIDKKKELKFLDARDKGYSKSQAELIAASPLFPNSGDLQELAMFDRQLKPKRAVEGMRDWLESLRESNQDDDNRAAGMSESAVKLEAILRNLTEEQKVEQADLIGQVRDEVTEQEKKLARINEQNEALQRQAIIHDVLWQRGDDRLNRLDDLGRMIETPEDRFARFAHDLADDVDRGIVPRDLALAAFDKQAEGSLGSIGRAGESQLPPSLVAGSAAAMSLTNRIAAERSAGDPEKKILQDQLNALRKVIDNGKELNREFKRAPVAKLRTIR